MLLFRETGWGLHEVMDMPLQEVYFWVMEAVKLRKKI